MNRSLSKRSSVDGSRTYTVLSIPDGIEEQRPSTNEDAYVSLSFIFTQIGEIWFPFVAHAIASPGWCYSGCITLNIKLLAAGVSLIPHLIMCLIWTISLPFTLCSRMIMRKLLLSSVFQKHPSLPKLWEKIISVSWEKTIVLISCIAVALDPLFFYIPIINETKKCLDMDSELMIVVLVLRSLSDLVFIFRIATRVRELIDEIFDGNYPFPNFKYASDDSLLNLLVILPVQQVAIIICFFRLRSPAYPRTTTILNIFLGLHPILRAYHIYYFHKHLKIVRKWTNAALNFFLYILAAHALGAFWYFFSVQREISCWHRVCRNTTGCITTYYCKDSTTTIPSVTDLNDFCPISSEKATGNAHDFHPGIYLDAFKYGTTGSINFPTKFMYTFWWGLKNLSNFGTNLQTSSYLWENFFTILIAVIGWLLFLYLIGNVQTYIQSASQKVIADAQEIIRDTHKKIGSWMSKHLSSCDESVQMGIIRDIRERKTVERKYDRNMDMDVDVQFFFSCLNNYDATRIKRLLCEHALNKVLWRMSPQFLQSVFERLKPVVYEKKSRVVRTKEPIHTILFIVDGEIVASNEGLNAGVASSIGKSRYGKGDIFGEEIFSLRDQSAPLISNRDYRCEKKVEAFALTYESWRTIQKFQSNKTVVVYSKSHLILLNKAYRKLTTTRWGDIEREIGMKMNLKSDAFEDEKSRENTMISIKETDIRDWLSRNGFSEDAKRNIMAHIKCIVKQTIDDDVDIKYLLSHLPWDIQMTIRKQLGMKSLTKVPMLQKMDDSLLSIMCEKYFQPEIYSEKTYLVRAGEPVDLMFIIIEGKVICTDMTSEAAGSFRRLEKGHLYGEQLLRWASPSNLFSVPVPISTEHVICLTKVEALALTASQFRSLVASFNSQWISNFNMCSDSQQLNEDCIKKKQLNEDPAFPYDSIDQQLMETYMHLESEENGLIEDEELRQKFKIMLKENEILDWVSSLGLSEDITKQIKRSIKISKVVEENIDADVNLEYVLSILPSNIKKSLKEHICISTLKEVSILEDVDEDLLERICLNLEPVILPQDRYIIKTGEELDQMIIVVKGVVECTATSNESATPPVTKLLKKGDLFGEEILAWAFPDIFCPPISNRDITCQTNVEALAFTKNGFQSVLSYYKKKHYNISDEQWEELTPSSPLGLQGGMVVADTSLSSSTTLEQRLDQLLQLQVSQGRRLEEMADKLGFGTTTPPAI